MLLKTSVASARVLKNTPRNVSGWALVERKDMACTFLWKNMASEQRAVMIPPLARKYFAADAGSRKATTSTNGGKKE